MISGLLGIIKDFQSALGYFNINQKILNQIYLGITVLPLGYLIYIVVGMFINHHVANGIIWLLILGVLLYFWIINFLYYVFDKNTKADITQMLPEKVLDQVALKNQANNQMQEKRATAQPIINNLDELGITINVKLTDENRLKLTNAMNKLIHQKKIHTQSIGYIVPKNTLYPDYYTKYIANNKYDIYINDGNDNYINIGNINTYGHKNSIIGLYVNGGDEINKNIHLRHQYRLTILLEKKE